jgi:ubiquinol-cytochrome c reductase iron-sulfur subunit
MSNDNIMDEDRRRFLRNATSVVGGLGLGMAAIPFIGSWLPNARTQSLGAPVQVDLSKIAPGQRITVAWRGQPIFIVNRTPEALASLEKDITRLRDPDSHESTQPKYITGPYRSSSKEFLIVIGICTHLGCVPLYKPEVGSVEASWIGGFFCPCHGSKFDFSGRVFKGVPAPANLVVPPYKHISDTVVLIGEDPS